MNPPAIFTPELDQGLEWIPAGSVPTFFVAAYDYAWFVGFALTFSAYLVLRKMHGNRAFGETLPDWGKIDFPR